MDAFLRRRGEAIFERISEHTSENLMTLCEAMTARIHGELKNILEGLSRDYTDMLEAKAAPRENLEGWKKVRELLSDVDASFKPEESNDDLQSSREIGARSS